MGLGPAEVQGERWDRPPRELHPQQLVADLRAIAVREDKPEPGRHKVDERREAPPERAEPLVRRGHAAGLAERVAPDRHNQKTRVARLTHNWPPAPPALA